MRGHPCRTTQPLPQRPLRRGAPTSSRAAREGPVPPSGPPFHTSRRSCLSQTRASGEARAAEEHPNSPRPRSRGTRGAWGPLLPHSPRPALVQPVERGKGCGVAPQHSRLKEQSLPAHDGVEGREGLTCFMYMIPGPWPGRRLAPEQRPPGCRVR